MKFDLDPDVESLLKRFDRTSPQTLLQSMATEFLRLGRAYAALAARVEAMDALQATVDRIIATGQDADPSSFPSSMRIVASDAMQSCIGFHKLEYDENGQPFRWTGPETHFSFPLFLDRRQPARFRLQVGGLATQASIDTLRCLVDAVEVDCTFAQNPLGWQAIGPLPPRPDSGGTVLTFVCPKVFSPSEVHGSEDRRRLGAIFQSLTIEQL